MRVSGQEPCAPKRPTLGPLGVLALSACGGVAVAEELAWRAYNEERAIDCCLVVAVLLALLAAVFIVCLLARRRGARVRGHVPNALLVCAVGACAALSCGTLYWSAWSSDVEQVEGAVSEGLVVHLVSDPSQQGYGTVSVATAHAGRHEASVRIKWPEQVQALPAGHAVLVTGSLLAPGTDDGGRWNHRNGYCGMLAASSVEDRGFAPGLGGIVAPFRDASFDAVSEVGGEAAGLLAGVLLGNRTLYAGTELEQDFRTTGLAHLMAVSGTHLAVVTALAGWLVARIRAPRAARCAVLTVLLVCYVSLTCFAASAVRACIMCVVALLAGVALRRAHVLSALFACVFVMALVSPQVVFSLGFQLSVLAVFGLVMFTPLISSWLEFVTGGRLRKLCELLAATLAATLATLPASIGAFAQFPLIAPLSSVLVSPFVTFVLGLGLAGILVHAVAAPLGMALLYAAGVVASFAAALVHALADMPGACVPVSAEANVLGAGFLLCAVALWAFWPLPPLVKGEARQAALGLPDGRRIAFPGGPPARAIAALAIALPPLLVMAVGMGSAGLARFAFPFFKSPAEVVMVDVGQGDCMLIRDGGASVLVDTGKDRQVLERGLARNGVTHLDAVYITHKDADHCGALPALTGVVSVDHVYVHADLLSNPVMEQVLEDARWVTGGRGAEGVRVGDVTRIGSFALTLVAPERGGESENADSLVNLLEYDAQGDGVPEFRGLLTGDAEAEATSGVAEKVGDVDFLKVAHHGSRKGETAEELSVLKPEVALIGVGADNEYGHPTKQALGMLERCGARVYRTDLQGDITLSFSAQAMGVKTQK